MPKRRNETWAEFAERQERENPGLFGGKGPVAFTRPEPAAQPTTPAAQSPPAARPTKKS